MNYLRPGGRTGRIPNLKITAQYAVVEAEVEKHECHVETCDTRVHPRLLMCAYHWRLVPTILKLAVWEHYVPGQEVSKTPTAAYLNAAKAAIQAVEEIVRLKDARKYAR
jgi:hypothetical protein